MVFCGCMSISPVSSSLRVGRAQFISTLLALAAAFWSAAPAAHDFWIEPSVFRAAPGAEVALRLYVGQDFRGEPLIYLPELHERYVYVDADGERQVEGIPGDDPAGKIQPRGEGAVIVGYRSAAFTISFETLAEFEAYLAKEGLEHIGALRRRLGKRGSNITERYSRAAKALVNVGRAKADAGDRRLGFTLELVAECNPYALVPGAELPLRLYYRDRPLANALVIAFRKDAPLAKLRARTDRDGRVRLPLARPGIWLVTAVHMVPAAKNVKADWDSIWASLTFELSP